MRAVVAGLVICGLVSAAHADRANRADQLFKKGKKLLAEKKYPEACTTFEQSDRLDPGIGVKLNVAKCYQDWGKLATAWRWYTDAENMATAAKDDRAEKIHALIVELDQAVPRLTVSLPPEAIIDHVVVKLDGVELDLAALGERRVDPGPHTIETIVDGARRARTVPLERGGSAEVTLEVPTRSRPKVAPKSPVVDTDPGRNRRWIGLGISGTGVVAVAVAGIVTLRARSDYQHALSGYCGGATDMCDGTGLSRTHSARHRANIATGVALVGVAAVAGGLYLYLTAPHAGGGERAGHALYVAPALGDGTGVVLGGAF